MAVFVSEGDHIPYTPSGAVAAGDVVVQGELVAIADHPIAANVPGSLTPRGTYSFPKATGGGTAITAGAVVYWNTSTSKAQTTASTFKKIGKVVTAAGDSDATVLVRLSQ